MKQETETVFNQSPPFEDVNLFASDRALQEAVEREGGGDAVRSLNAFGLVCGSGDAFARGRLANVNPPQLKTHDRFGNRIDDVVFHPSYHECMDISFAEGLHCSSWMHHQPSFGADGPVPGAQVSRAAAFYMAAQMESGHCCPISMTHAALPVIAAQTSLRETWLPKLLSRTYDYSRSPIEEKQSATLGMGMTECQGGTDVRANTTRAEADGAEGAGSGVHRINGRKWFMSAPMSDAFLVLAQATAGLSCFLVPRFLEDGSKNGILFQRLKDKLGNRSNASSEAVFDNAFGVLLGEEGAGIETIIEMVTYTRLDCAVSSAGLMRLALANAINHCEHREVFGKTLVSQPLMQHVLADLALDVEAATALAFRLGRSFDRCEDPRASAWRRLMTPVTKYWVCKIAPTVIGEAMECLGGNGYVEEAPLARLYREAPVNAIWEGSGNVMGLDVLRVLQREPDVAEVVLDDLLAACGDDAHLKAAHKRIQGMLHEPRLLDVRARALMEALAVLAAGTILRAHAPVSVADAFIATRMGSLPRQTYGQGLEWVEVKPILERASPN